MDRNSTHGDRGASTSAVRQEGSAETEWSAAESEGPKRQDRAAYVVIRRLMAISSPLPMGTVTVKSSGCDFTRARYSVSSFACEVTLSATSNPPGRSFGTTSSRYVR